ncbi:hypothetical protein ACOMHN_006785 [Nucella lapillus]
MSAGCLECPSQATKICDQSVQGPFSNGITAGVCVSQGWAMGCNPRLGRVSSQELTRYTGMGFLGLLSSLTVVDKKCLDPLVLFLIPRLIEPFQLCP